VPRSAFRFAALSLTFAAAYAEAPAHANGRFPRAQQLVISRSDPNRMFLRATFGVIASTDGGQRWRWLCEQAMGFSGSWDPPIAIAPKQELVVGLTDGLATTADACTIHTTLPGELVSDLSVTTTGELMLALSTPGKPATVRVRNAAGRLSPAGPGLPGIYIDTLDAAPSRPARVYATGVRVGASPEPHLFVSNDRGATLRELHPKLEAQGRLFLSAIDPRDPDHIFIRALGESGSDLIVSRDGGASFRVALHLDGAMQGFAMSPDGQRVWVGSTDPQQGIYRSRDGGETFTQGARLVVYCLAYAANTLYACSEAFRPGGFAVGISHDDGATVAPLARFSDVDGPARCDAGAGAQCDGEPWAQMHATLAAVSAPAPEVDAPPPQPDAGRSPSPPADAPGPATGRACACSVPASGAPRPGSLGALFALAIAGLRRRSRPTRVDRSAPTALTHPDTTQPSTINKKPILQELRETHPLAARLH
jgi:hypothetical protein